MAPSRAAVCLLCFSASLAHAYLSHGDAGSAPGVLVAAMTAIGSLGPLHRQTLLGKLHDLYIDTPQQLCALTAEQWTEDLFLPSSVQNQLTAMGYRPSAAPGEPVHLPTVAPTPPVSRRTARRNRAEQGRAGHHQRKILEMTRGWDWNSTDTEPAEELDRNHSGALTGLMNYILHGYDPKIRPGAASGKPLDLKLSITIFELSEVDTAGGVWGCYFRQFFEFTDLRLVYQPSTIAPRKALALYPRFKGRLWEPDETWTNQKHITGPIRETYYIFPAGKAKIKSHWHGKFMFHARLSMFPFDSHWLEMEVALPSYDDSFVTLDFQRPDSFTVKDGSIGEFSISAGKSFRNFSTVNTAQAEGELPHFFTHLTFGIHMHRAGVVWLIRFFLPLTAMFILAYGTFYLNPRSGLRSPICIYTFTCTIYYYMMLVEQMPFSVNVSFMAVYMIVSLVLVLWCLFCFVSVAVATREGGPYDEMIAQEEADDLPEGTAPKVIERTRRRSITFQTPMERGSRKADGLKLDLLSRNYYPYVVITMNLLATMFVLTNADADDYK